MADDAQRFGGASMRRDRDAAASAAVASATDGEQTARVQSDTPPRNEELVNNRDRMVWGARNVLHAASSARLPPLGF